MTHRIFLLLLLLLPAVLSAQAAPKRPKLDRDADANDWRAYYMAGMKVIVENPAKAADMFWWASRLSPGSPEPLQARWVALWLRDPGLLRSRMKPGGKDEAKALAIDSVLLAALEIDPFVPQQYSRLVYEEMPGMWSGDAFTTGFLAYTEGNYGLALSNLKRASTGEASRPARYVRALSFAAQRQYDSVAAELTALAALAREDNAKRTRIVYETSSIYEYGAAMAKARLGDMNGARASLTRALEEDLAMAAAHVALAQVAEKQGYTEEALREWTAALELRPGNAAWHDGYATALRNAKRDEEAVAAYEKAIALEPHWAAPYWNLAVALEQLGRKPDAARRYQEFAARAPIAYADQVASAQSRAARLSQ
jgi:tetratricopeptide (TPR) repeat protein